MVQSINPAVCGNQRLFRVSAVFYLLGGLLSSVPLGVAVYLAGVFWLRDLVTVEVPVLLLIAFSFLYGIHEFRLFRVPYFQRRKQVPRKWLRKFPLPVTSFLFGWVLGFGFTVHVRSPAFYVLLTWVLFQASFMSTLLLMVLYSLGRNLLVLWVDRYRDFETLWRFEEGLVANEKSFGFLCGFVLMTYAGYLIAA